MKTIAFSIVLYVSVSRSLQGKDHNFMKKLKEMTGICIPSIQTHLAGSVCQRKSDVIHYRCERKALSQP